MPAPSNLHEEIANDVWQIFQVHVVNKYGSAFSKQGVMFSFEPRLADVILGITDPKNRKADFYFEQMMVMGQ